MSDRFGQSRKRLLYLEREKWPAMGEQAKKEIECSGSWTVRVRDMIAQIEPILGRK